MEHRAPWLAAGVAFDVAVAVLVLALPSVLWLTGSQPFDAVNAIGPVASAVALVWRRRRPAVVLAITAALAVAETAVAQSGALLLPFAVAVYTVVSLGRRRLGLGTAAGAAVVLDGVLLLRGESPSSGVVAAVPLLLALACVVGLVVAARRAELAAARDRARRAEETREAESRRAVAEERVRIARELHDVLAHQVAVVGVQAGVAEALLADDPDVAREALVHVRTASQAALRELATLLELLRRADTGDDDGAAAGRDPRVAPAPSMSGLPELLDAARDTGLRVYEETVGAARSLVPVVDLAGYRVAQEALTNAHKHGTGTADVRVAWLPGALELTVSNPVPAGAAPGSGTGGAGDPSSSTGYGLVGMRERVASVGGTLDAGPRGGRFVVRALLPTPLPPTQDPEEAP